MKKIIGYLRTYFKTECNYVHLLVILLFAAGMTFVNYRHYFEPVSLTFEDTYIKSADNNNLLQIFRYFQMYFLAFGGSFFLIALLDYKNKTLRDPRLWGMIIFITLCFTLRAWSLQGHNLSLGKAPAGLESLWRKCSSNLSGMLTLLIPGAIYWFFADRKNQPLYGFHAKGVSLAPYFVLLAMMVPLIIWASTQVDFLRQYPTTQSLYLPVNMPNKNWYTAVYELCYGLDFLYTEFFFRGLIILGLARWVGHHAILPMCALYVTIHFDKPMAEAVSSFFGGYLLAILAYHSRSIYGGVIVHLGIAWLMDLIATIALSVK